MKRFLQTILFTSVLSIILSVNIYAANAEFITCDENGASTGTLFSKATITVSDIDMSGNYIYHGVDVAVFKKPTSGSEWATAFQKRIPTNSLKIQITDFGDESKYNDSEIYALAYRVLYTMIDSEEGSIIETEWKRIEGSYFRIKGAGEVGVKPAERFLDVSKEHWAYEAIIEMEKRGVISGFSDGTFRPSDKVTREQFAKLMVLGLNLSISEPDQATFTDITKEDWSYKYVEAVKQYLSGYVGNNGKFFNGRQNATREDIVIALVKAKGYDKETVDIKRLEGLFKDSNAISKRAEKYVLLGYDKNLLSGYDDGTFKPKGELTRAEAVTLLYRIIK